MPPGDGPATVVRIADAEFVAATHESLDVICAIAEMTVPHRVDELFHLEAGLQVTLGPVKLDVAIGEEINGAGIGAIGAVATDYRVFGVIDGAEVEKGFVELCQARQVVRAEVHVMKLEVHGGLGELNKRSTPSLRDFAGEVKNLNMNFAIVPMSRSIMGFDSYPAEISGSQARVCHRTNDALLERRMKTSSQEAEQVAPAETKLYSAPALEKGLDILEMLSLSQKPLTQKEIALRLGRSVGEIYRMISCLLSRNYVALVNENTFGITTKLYELAHAYPPTHRLLLEATPVMQRLAGELDQSCHLTVYGQGKQVVLYKVDSPSGMGFSVRVGAELDVLISASGRVLLAFQNEQTRKLRIEESERRRPQHTDPEIEARLSAIRTAGHESMPSVQVRGLYAVSFPVLDSGGQAIAALTVPFAERIDQQKRKSVAEVTKALQDAAQILSARVGGGPQPQSRDDGSNL